MVDWGSAFSGDPSGSSGGSSGGADAGDVDVDVGGGPNPGDVSVDVGGGDDGGGDSGDSSSDGGSNIDVGGGPDPGDVRVDVGGDDSDAGSPVDVGGGPDPGDVRVNPTPDDGGQQAPSPGDVQTDPSGGDTGSSQPAAPTPGDVQDQPSGGATDQTGRISQPNYRPSDPQPTQGIETVEGAGGDVGLAFAGRQREQQVLEQNPGLSSDDVRVRRDGSVVLTSSGRDVFQDRAERINERVSLPAGGFESVRGGTPGGATATGEGADVSTPAGGFESIRGGTPGGAQPSANIDQDDVSRLVADAERFLGVDSPIEGPVVERDPRAAPGEQFGDVAVRVPETSRQQQQAIASALGAIPIVGPAARPFVSPALEAAEGRRVEELGAGAVRSFRSDVVNPAAETAGEIAAPLGEFVGREIAERPDLTASVVRSVPFAGPTAAPITRAGLATTDPETAADVGRDVAQAQATGGVRGVGDIAAVPVTGPLAVKEGVEFGGAAAGAVGEGRGEEFAGRAGLAAGALAVQAGEAAAERPFEVSGRLGASLVASGGAIGAAYRVSPVAGRLTSVAIQPGEEAVIAAARSGLLPARVATKVPGVRRGHIGRVDTDGGLGTGLRSRLSRPSMPSTDRSLPIRAGSIEIRSDPDAPLFDITRSRDPTPTGETRLEAGQPVPTSLGVEGIEPRVARALAGEPQGRAQLGQPISQTVGGRTFSDLGQPSTRLGPLAEARLLAGRPLATDVGAEPTSLRAARALAGEPQGRAQFGQPISQTVGGRTFGDLGGPTVEYGPLGETRLDVGRPLAGDLGAEPTSLRLSRALAGEPQGRAQFGQPISQTVEGRTFGDLGRPTVEYGPLGEARLDVGRPLAPDIGEEPFSSRLRRGLAGEPQGRAQLGQPISQTIGGRTFGDLGRPTVEYGPLGEARVELGRPISQTVTGATFTDVARAASPRPTRTVGPLGETRLALGRPLRQDVAPGPLGEPQGRQQLGQPLAQDLGRTPLSEFVFEDLTISVGPRRPDVPTTGRGELDVGDTEFEIGTTETETVETETTTETDRPERPAGGGGQRGEAVGLAIEPARPEMETAGRARTETDTPRARAEAAGEMLTEDAAAVGTGEGLAETIDIGTGLADRMDVGTFGRERTDPLADLFTRLEIGSEIDVGQETDTRQETRLRTETRLEQGTETEQRREFGQEPGIEIGQEPRQETGRPPEDDEGDPWDFDMPAGAVGGGATAVDESVISPSWLNKQVTAQAGGDIGARGSPEDIQQFEGDLSIPTAAQADPDEFGLSEELEQVENLYPGAGDDDTDPLNLL